MLIKRIITALILFPIAIGGVLFLPTLYFEYATSILGLLIAREWSVLCGANHLWKQGLYLVSLVGLAFLCADYMPLIYIYSGSACFWLLAAIWLWVYPKGSFLWQRKFLTPYLIGYLILIPCWFAINQVRQSPDGNRHLLLLFIIVWSADIGAYFIGNFCGKHKLLPEVSPNKTREGFYGGCISALVFSVLYVWLFDNYLLSSAWFIVLILVSFFYAVLGDLMESMAKRLSGVKDSGNWLPGHGGLLDRLDSILAAAPVYALILWSLL